ncbi:MAG: hypothetical protein PHI77_01035 [Candidatus Pacebacteria bacterium]|nr:hypothetical protein [Candidatus Paceibacterota bacterium]MDD4874972.1 hypothetical protein [Candidatus Paceibacterota bacterium]
MLKVFYLFQPEFNKKERKKIIEKTFNDFDLFVFICPSGTESKDKFWADIFFSPEKVEKNSILAKIDQQRLQRFQILNGYNLSKKNKSFFVDVVSAVCSSGESVKEGLEEICTSR